MSEPRQSITVRLLCFSQLRHALGCDSLQVELPAGSSAAALEAEVRALLPEALRALVFRLAINHSFADRSDLLSDGDEVALLPPMQGG